jgi:hypothetical protein
VKALVRALAAAERDREAAEARRREAETLAGKAVADLRAAEEDHQGRVEATGGGGWEAEEDHQGRVEATGGGGWEAEAQYGAGQRCGWAL